MENYQKLLGRINVDLYPGNYQLEIQNSSEQNKIDFNVSKESILKSFTIMKINHLGGKQVLPIVLFFLMGALSVLFSIFFFIQNKGKKLKVISKVFSP